MINLIEITNENQLTNNYILTSEVMYKKNH